MEKARRQASALSTEILHHTPLVQGEVEINTKTLNNTALQALYERINAYKDPLLKNNSSQLKQEQPDFKPQVDAKQFLQYIAYGEQTKRKAFCKKPKNS